MKNKSPYIHDIKVHNSKSALEVIPFIIELIDPQSVVDIGCGLGDWLSIFQKSGIKNILGVDGKWVNKNNLYINPDFFLEADLTKPFDINTKFDLAMSLEVAEHLPESVADTFVETLTKLSDNIIFSAAIPNQDGQNHINEQWHTYWIKKFEIKGFYCHDIIRPSIWENENVAWWYKQNMFFFCKKPFDKPLFVNNLHPGLLQDKIDRIIHLTEGRAGIRLALKHLLKSIKFFLIK